MRDLLQNWAFLSSLGVRSRSSTGLSDCSQYDGSLCFCLASVVELCVCVRGWGNALGVWWGPSVGLEPSHAAGTADEEFLGVLRLPPLMLCSRSPLTPHHTWDLCLLMLLSWLMLCKKRCQESLSHRFDFSKAWHCLLAIKQSGGCNWKQAVLSRLSGTWEKRDHSFLSLWNYIDKKWN